MINKNEHSKENPGASLQYMADMIEDNHNASAAWHLTGPCPTQVFSDKKHLLHVLIHFLFSLQIQFQYLILDI